MSQQEHNIMTYIIVMPGLVEAFADCCVITSRQLYRPAKMEHPGAALWMDMCSTVLVTVVL